MDKEALSFSEVKINNDFLKEIWQLDPRTLDQIDGAKLSSYAVALAQYLIYFNFQRNQTKAEIHRINTYVERRISMALITEMDLPKACKTKKAAADYLVTSDMELMRLQEDLDRYRKEILQVEGMGRVVSELIATIKRELTRRENELYQIRRERKN